MHWAMEAFKTFNSNAIPHIVTTNIEHCATELPLKKWRDHGQAEVTFVQVDKSTGMVTADAIERNLKTNTALVSVMMANNETGVIQPLKDIAEMMKKVNERRKIEGQFQILIHTDAAQAFGKIPVSVQDLLVDYMTIVGHKVIIDDERFRELVLNFPICSFMDLELALFIIVKEFLASLPFLLAEVKSSIEGQGQKILPWPLALELPRS